MSLSGGWELRARGHSYASVGVWRVEANLVIIPLPPCNSSPQPGIFYKPLRVQAEEFGTTFWRYGSSDFQVYFEISNCYQLPHPHYI